MVLSLDEWGVTDFVQVGVCTERQALSDITVSFLFAQSANLIIFIEEVQIQDVNVYSYSG